MAARLALPSTTAPRTVNTTSFLTMTPPSWAARGLAYALITIFVIGAIASVAVTLPERVTASFVLVPVRGADPVKASRGGVVGRVMVSEGQSVERGEVLLTMRSEVAGERSAELQTIETRLSGAGESFLNSKLKFDSLRQSDDQERRKLEARAAHLDTLTANKRQQLALSEGIYESIEKLYREGIASQTQLAAKKIELSEMASDIERLVAEKRDTMAEIEKIGLGSLTRAAEIREFERDFKEKLRTSEIRAASLKDGLTDASGSEVRLVAPCTGTILRLKVNDSGAVLSEGQTVAELTCGGDALQAELMVPESGLGKVKLSQGVKLKFDAFPYQRYGIKGGKLVWLSPAKAEGETTSFTARVALNEKDIDIKGRARPFAPGMVGTAEIVVGKRTLVSYVFEPIRQLRENLADAP